MNQTQNFFNIISTNDMMIILDSIAKNNGITTDDAYEKVTREESHNLLEYLVEPVRSFTYLRMKKHNMLDKEYEGFC